MFRIHLADTSLTGDRICPSAVRLFSLLSQLRGAAVLSGRLVVSCLYRAVTLIGRKLSCRNHGNPSRVNNEMQLRRTNAGPEPVQTQCWASFRASVSIGITDPKRKLLSVSARNMCSVERIRSEKSGSGTFPAVGQNLESIWRRSASLSPGNCLQYKRVYRDSLSLCF